ncbi:asparagine synthase (glutamine-hydrolyzing) [Pedobacter montanisoli]|uniref:asparagine synthase (glutamine-hydrolyzing) n=1 Tax=Pedobacter montanisoli TaxID=2923277 RepID=A0ABS9ZSD4_9SPHI|nr:asparagine synthase (glutamine-hydrolyzing) [Pedobacter montanisoli]MCJ0741499.1 asparagine synthase (glutamine-hydrolyzing) [Pedobacter montanisoli]
MCGIIGFYDTSEKALPILNKLIDNLHHRGPDGDGKILKDGYAFGHVRLSLVDLTSGAQPIIFQELTIVFNGEIYNHKDLRAQLIKDGYKFETTSDTEVLLKLFHQKGPECIDLLNGIFAFSIYNALTGEVFLGRDLFGIKPLYYINTVFDFAFASEWKTLFTYIKEKKIPYVINQKALTEYFSHGYPYREKLIEEIQTVQRGAVIRFKRETQPEIVYQMQLNDSQNSSLEDIESVLSKQVGLELDADVEVGVLLSGGIDSSLVTYFASKLKKKIKTFSIGYAEGKRYDETKYAKIVSEKFDTDHHIFTFSEDDLLNELPQLIDCLDQPVYDPAMLPLLFLSKNVKKHVKAALSGDGGDELFGGYTHYRVLKYKPLFGFAHKILRTLAPHNNKVKTLGNMLNDIHKPKGPFMYNLSLLNYEPETHEIDKTWQQTMYEEIDTTLQKKLLVKTDLSSMYYGLEIRVPFLNKRLFELSKGLSSTNFINLFYGKTGLRKLTKKYVNGDIAYKPKKGFRVPLNTWIRNSKLGKHIEHTLETTNVIPENVISKEHINWLLANKNSLELGNEIFSLYILNEWLKKHQIIINENTPN